MTHIRKARESIPEMTDTGSEWPHFQLRAITIDTYCENFMIHISYHEVNFKSFFVKLSSHKSFDSPSVSRSHKLFYAYIYDGRFKHNSGVLPPVHELYKRPSQLLRHPENGSFKNTITQILTTVRGMEIAPLLRYPQH
jgi:hypothetical protein